jgi:NDP-sugar pyrophosphorylase family protein
MQCVILAGGLATRMRPATDSVPKALLPVAGRPFADLQLSWLASQGVTDVVYCTAYLGEMIAGYVQSGSRWGLRVTYSDEGPSLVGTGGALRLTADRSLLDDDVFVLYGDSYLQVELDLVEAAYRSSGLPALMTVYHDRAALERSNVRFVDGVVELYRKGLSAPAFAGLRHVDYGLQVLSRRIIVERIPPEQTVDLSDVQHALSVEGLLAGFEVAERFYEIGSAAGLRALEQHVADAATFTMSRHPAGARSSNGTRSPRRG